MSVTFVNGADVLVRATPLIITGLSVAIAFRAGVLNIGAEGQFLMGATAATFVGVTAAPNLGIAALPAALVAGACAGGIWAGIAAFLRNRFNVLEVISTIMLNFVASYTVSYLVRGALQEHTHVYPQTETIATVAQLPRFMAGTRLHAGIVLAFILAGITWWIFRSTATGFRIRATGTNALAAASAGEIDTQRVTTRVFITSGALAGLAGAIEVCGVTFALYENISPGYGYTAIAVALLAALNPLGIIASGVLFGILESGASGLQRDANIPATLATVLEAGIVLVILAIGQLRRQRRPSTSII